MDKDSNSKHTFKKVRKVRLNIHYPRGESGWREGSKSLRVRFD